MKRIRRLPGEVDVSRSRRGHLHEILTGAGSDLDGAEQVRPPSLNQASPPMSPESLCVSEAAWRVPEESTVSE